jgi:hypothetical protein
VGAIALTPVAASPRHTALAPERVVSTLAVNLAAAIDPITPWVDTVKASWDNVKGLTALYLQQPFPLLQTIAKNQITYLQELPDIGLIASQVWGNVQTFFQAPYESTPDNISDSQVTTIEGLPISQQTVYALLQTFLVSGESALSPLIDFTPTRVGGDLQPLLQFTATPVSGELVGLLGPLISPLIQLTESFTAVGRYWQAGKPLEALNELINIPANVTNATLNGGKYLDLTGVVKTLGFTLPPEITSVGLNMGGLLNVVPIGYEPPTVPTSDIHPYSGGLAFDALATEVQSVFSFNDPGWPVGAIGSVMGLGQALGDAMLVTPPTPAATRISAAATVAPQSVEAAAPVAAKPEVSPAAPAIADITPPSAPTAAEAPAPRRGLTAAGNAHPGNDHATRASSRGKSASARHGN